PLRGRVAPGQVDGAHAAAAEGLFDDPRAESYADHGEFRGRASPLPYRPVFPPTIRAVGPARRAGQLTPVPLGARDLPRSATVTTALLLIAHGSRQPEANADLRHVAEGLLQRGYGVVEAAFLELAGPDIGEGGRRCARRGATRVVLVPYFLS